MKKWIAAIAGLNIVTSIGAAIFGFILFAIVIVSYNIAMEDAKLTNKEEESASVNDLVGENCPCGCEYVGDTGSTGGGSSNSGRLTFTGSEDKSDFGNSAFYFNKIACDEIGVPLWVPYAVNSGETGGTLYGSSSAISWNGGQFSGLDASVATNLYYRKNGVGAAGFFQVEGNSIEDEMGHIGKDIDKYLGIMSKAGLNSSKYPGMQSVLVEEIALGYTNWYQDCTYYPGAAMNHIAALKEYSGTVSNDDWLKNEEWFNQLSASEKEFVTYYVAMTLWNNGTSSLSYYKSSDNDLYSNYLKCFVDILRNHYEEFCSQKWRYTTGNGGNGSYSNAKNNLESAEWVITTSSAVDETIKSAMRDELRKDGDGSSHLKVLFRRFCAYGTNEVYNAFSKNSSASVLNGLEVHGIEITGGWSPFSHVSTSWSNGDFSTGTNSGSNGSTGSTGSLGGISSGESLGKFISDTTLNPQGMPLYDGFTLDSSKYEYFDTDYSKFHNGTYDSSSVLYGLGDFTNKAAKNAITYEGATAFAKSSPSFESKGQYSVMDGRITFAAPPSFVVTGEEFAEVQRQIKDASLYKKPGRNDPPVLNGNGNVGNYNGTTARGLYFDIVLDNGTVVPGIIADSKGMHHGTYPNKKDKLYHDDTESEGYCQLKFNLSADGGRGTLSYKTILELVGGNSNSVLTSTIFKGRKIMGVRTYLIRHNKASNFTNYFTEGGTNSSFGLEGGNATGNASIGGSGGGSTNITDGLNPNDPNWRCNCSIPCDKCGCHSSNDDSSGTFKSLEETPGIPQGIYSDLSGKSLSGEEVWKMFEEKAPNIASVYKPGIGVKPAYTSITTQDKWRGKFGDTIGTIHYLQHGDLNSYIHYPHVYAGRGSDGFSSVTSTGSLREDGLATFYSSGCGFCACSIVASTMLHRYITPPEVIMASYLSSELNNSDSKNDSIYAGKVLNYNGADNIFDSFRFNGKKLFNTKMASKPNQEDWNNTLNNGGMIIFSSHAKWTKNGHFVVVRELLGNGNYLTVDSSNWEGGGLPEAKTSLEHPWSDFTDSSVNANQIVMVTPGEGYAEYIASMTSGGGVGSTGVNINTSADTKTILNMKSESELVLAMTGGKYDSYNALNTVWRMGADGRKIVKAVISANTTQIEFPCWVMNADGTKVSSTKKMTVNKVLASYFTDFLTDLYNLPEKYVIDIIGGFNVRCKGSHSNRENCSSHSLSGHSLGGTVDINWEERGMAYNDLSVREQSSLEEPHRSKVCTWDSSWKKLADSYKLNWGGTWKSPIDGMHFSIVGDQGNGSFPNYNTVPKNKGQ